MISEGMEVNQLAYICVILEAKIGDDSLATGIPVGLNMMSYLTLSFT